MEAGEERGERRERAAEGVARRRRQEAGEERSGDRAGGELQRRDAQRPPVDDAGSSTRAAQRSTSI
jgi:hypothetical protein